MPGKVDRDNKHLISSNLMKLMSRTKKIDTWFKHVPGIINSPKLRVGHFAYVRNMNFSPSKSDI
jgi:hypothetical protein